MSRKKQISRKKLKVVSLVSVPLLAGLGVVIANPASAGTNGQEIQICQTESNYRTVTISGPNQDDQITQKDLSNLELGCQKVDGFFWKGDVTIVWADGLAGDPTAQTTCNVPEVAPEGFVRPCFGPRAPSFQVPRP
jgi:hypothetical protein